MSREYITYWLTRDADPIDGTPSHYVDVWFTRPVRHEVDRGAIWLDRDGMLDERFGCWSVGTARVFGTVPDDGRQCVRVGPEGDSKERLIARHGGIC